MVFRLLLLVIVILFAKSLFPGEREGQVQVATPSAPVVSQPAESGSAGPGHTQSSESRTVKSWRYFDPTDTITGKTYRVAQITSDNSLSLDFPYNGANYGTLTVRQHPQYGLDVIVTVGKGQILCRGSSHGRCVFKIRFDDGEVEDFTALKAADGSSTTVFSAYPKWAVNKLVNAKRITVQMLMYKAGNQTLTFTVAEPLKW